MPKNIFLTMSAMLVSAFLITACGDGGGGSATGDSTTTEEPTGDSG